MNDHDFPHHMEVMGCAKNLCNTWSYHWLGVLLWLTCCTLSYLPTSANLWLPAVVHQKAESASQETPNGAKWGSEDYDWDVPHDAAGPTAPTHDCLPNENKTEFTCTEHGTMPIQSAERQPTTQTTRTGMAPTRAWPNLATHPQQYQHQHNTPKAHIMDTHRWPANWALPTNPQGCTNMEWPSTNNPEVARLGLLGGLHDTNTAMQGRLIDQHLLQRNCLKQGPWRWSPARRLGHSNLPRRKGKGPHRTSPWTDGNGVGHPTSISNHWPQHPHWSPNLPGPKCACKCSHLPSIQPHSQQSTGHHTPCQPADINSTHGTTRQHPPLPPQLNHPPAMTPQSNPLCRLQKSKATHNGSHTDSRPQRGWWTTLNQWAEMQDKGSSSQGMDAAVVTLDWVWQFCTMF